MLWMIKNFLYLLWRVLPPGNLCLFHLLSLIYYNKIGWDLYGQELNIPIGGQNKQSSRWYHIAEVSNRWTHMVSGINMLVCTVVFLLQWHLRLMAEWVLEVGKLFWCLKAFSLPLSFLWALRMLSPPAHSRHTVPLWTQRSHPLQQGTSLSVTSDYRIRARFNLCTMARKVPLVQ